MHQLLPIADEDSWEGGDFSAPMFVRPPPDPPIGWGGRITKTQTVGPKLRLSLELQDLSTSSRSVLEAEGCTVTVTFDSGIVTRASIPATDFTAAPTSLALEGEAYWGQPTHSTVRLVLPSPLHLAAE